MNERDELLCAYLDGALDEAEARRVQAMVAADPALAREVDRLRQNDRLLRAAFKTDVPDEADPDTLRRFGIGAPVAASAQEPPRAANDNRWGWAAAGLAAGVALFFVPRLHADRDPWEQPSFSQALEVTPSLQQASLDRGAKLSPTLTFVAGDGRYCREFQLRSADARQSRDGIACRQSSGSWKAIALVAPAARADPNRIEVAGGPDTGGLDRTYQKLAGSDPLPAGQEKYLIANHWAKKSSQPVE